MMNFDFDVEFSNQSAQEIDVEFGQSNMVIAPELQVGVPGLSAYEVAVENGFDGTEEEWLDSLKGDPGNPGDNGVSPTVSVSKSGKVTTVSITDKNGTKTATVYDGADGYTPVKNKDYFDGAPGVSATHKWDGTVLTITSASGTSSADLKGKQGDPGKTPVKGVDYFDGKPGYTPLKGKDYFDGEPGKTPVNGTDYYTEADKAEMVQSVISALPVYDGSVVSV